MVRWGLKLREFGLVIHRKSGVTQDDGDRLSRYSVKDAQVYVIKAVKTEVETNTIVSLEPNHFLVEQGKDQWIQAIIETWKRKNLKHVQIVG